MSIGLSAVGETGPAVQAPLPVSRKPPNRRRVEAVADRRPLPEVR